MYTKKYDAQITVEFDPTNHQHRAAARAFLKRRAWADSPIRFTYHSRYGSVAHLVQEKLLLWYVAQEDLKTPNVKQSEQIEAKVSGI